MAQTSINAIKNDPDTGFFLLIVIKEYYSALQASLPNCLRVFKQENYERSLLPIPYIN